MRPLDWGAALFVVTIWALNFVVAKVGVGEIPPLLLLAVRFAIVAVLLAPFLVSLRQRWKTMLALSVVQGVLHFGLLFIGLQKVDAGPAAIAIQLAVPFSAVLAWIAYGERMGLWQISGMAIAFVGVYVLAGDPARSPDPVYFTLVVSAALAWACANLLIKRLIAVRPIAVSAWLALLTAPQMMLASLILETGQWRALTTADWRAWGAILYMALGASIVAYSLWYYLIGKHEINRVVPMTLLSPLLAVLLAAGLLGEPLSLQTMLGGALAISGLAMIHFLKISPTGRGRAAGTAVGRKSSMEHGT